MTATAKKTTKKVAKKTTKKAVAKKATVRCQVHPHAPAAKKTQVEHLRPEPAPTKGTKLRAKRAPKKPPFWNKAKGMILFHVFAASLAGGGLPIACYNVAHVQLQSIEGGSENWIWKALFVAAFAGFIFSSLTVFDLLADWLSSKVKAGAWVIVGETVMLLGIEEWLSVSMLGVLVVLNAGATFVTLEKRRLRREAEEQERIREERRNARQVRSHDSASGRRKAP